MSKGVAIGILTHTNCQGEDRKDRCFSSKDMGKGHKYFYGSKGEALDICPATDIFSMGCDFDKGRLELWKNNRTFSWKGMNIETNAKYYLGFSAYGTKDNWVDIL